ncbi:Ig-like domain-containing protein [Candidatus Giovannonibacteria bacterium]|nr:Ig-like domain-containing protein [Candidatus Giovannonibacteria bacterium]
MKKIISLGLLTVIAATAGGTVFEARALAAESVLSSVSITPASASIATGASTQLTAWPKDQLNGAFSGATTTWSSSNPSVAFVNTGGLVTGVALGTTTITASTASGTTTVNGTALITVIAPPQTQAPFLSSLLVFPRSAKVKLGELRQLIALPLDQFGVYFPAAISWTSASTSVATVSSNGLVTGLAKGKALITASALSGTTTVSGTALIKVKATSTPDSNISCYNGHRWHNGKHKGDKFCSVKGDKGEKWWKKFMQKNDKHDGEDDDD